MLSQKALTTICQPHPSPHPPLASVPQQAPPINTSLLTTELITLAMTPPAPWPLPPAHCSFPIPPCPHKTPVGPTTPRPPLPHHYFLDQYPSSRLLGMTSSFPVDPSPAQATHLPNNVTVGYSTPCGIFPWAWPTFSTPRLACTQNLLPSSAAAGHPPTPGPLPCHLPPSCLLPFPGSPNPHKNSHPSAPAPPSPRILPGHPLTHLSTAPDCASHSLHPAQILLSASFPSLSHSSHLSSPSLHPARYPPPLLKERTQPTTLVPSKAIPPAGPPVTFSSAGLLHQPVTLAPVGLHPPPCPPALSPQLHP